MLPRDYRFSIENTLGVTLVSGDVTIQGRRYNFNSSGTMIFESTETQVYDLTANLADGSFNAGAAIDNSASGFIGGAFELFVNATGGVNGDLITRFESSTDEGTTFDSESGLVTDQGRVVAVVNAPASGLFFKSFRL